MRNEPKYWGLSGKPGSGLMDGVGWLGWIALVAVVLLALGFLLFH